MSENNKYGTIINEKFSEFSFPDMDRTWPGMKDLLDKAMPQNKKRRFLLWLNWYTGSALFLLGLSIVALTIFALNSSGTSETTPQKNTTNRSETSETENIPASASFTNKNEVETKRTQKTVLLKTKAVNNLNKTSDTKTVISEGQKKNKTIQSSINNYAVNNKPAQLKHSNKTQHDQKHQQDKKIFNSSITANSPNNREPVQDNAVKENTFSELRFSKVDHLTTRLSVVGSDRFKISNPKNLNIELLKKDVLHQLIHSNDSTSATSTDSALSTASKKPKRNIGKGWVMGMSVAYNFPVSNQEMSTVNMNGKRNTLIDFLPSVYAQYHFNKKWYVESSFQFSSPQYISSHKLASVKKDINANKKEENAVWLNKLYYLNLPVSLHYHVLPNLTVGSGIQYSYLRRSIFADEIAVWEKQGTDWNKTASEKSIAVKSNAAVKKEKPNNGNGGGSTTPAPLTMTDTVARSLKSSDLRILFDVNYNLKRLNMGISFQLGLNNYINTTSGSYVLPVKDRNQALQLYLRYDILDKRKKK